MRIVFMGSPAFAVPSLRAVHSSSHEISAVVTQPDRPGGRKLKIHPPAIKVCAQELGLRVLQPETTRSPEFMSEIAAMRPDLLVVVAYGEILRKEFLDLPSRGAINLHASLLPKYRGAAPVTWAILNGELETGATTLLINEQMDAGDILLQEVCPIEEEDTTETLSRKISVLGKSLLTKTIDLWGANKIIPQSQDKNLVTYAPKLKKLDGLVDWNKTADWISRQVRAFHPWPGCYSFLEGLFIKFLRVQAAPGRQNSAPGTILGVSEDSILIACAGATALNVFELQPQGRPVLSAGDFLHGHRCSPGQQFSAQSFHS